MSANCLKTTLNASVNNDSIPALGSFMVTPEAVEGQYYFLNIVASSSVTIKAKGSSYLADSIAELSTNPKTKISGTDVSCYLPDDGGIFEITNKYAISKIVFEARNSSGARPNPAIPVKAINVAELKYSPIGHLDLLAVAYGDLAEIKELPVRTFLYLVANSSITNKKIGNLPMQSTQVYIQNSGIGSEDTKPNLSLIGSMTIASLIYLNNDIEGSLESLVAAYVENDRTNDTITVTPASNNITFGTYTIGNGTLSWDGVNKISYVTSSGNKVYAKGATTEEIAAWEQAGKTVYVVE